MDLERLLDDVGFVPNLNINTENLPFKDFWNPSCVHRPRVCLRRPRVSVAFIFKK